MPIELGDARLSFLADTSQLDAAIARLQLDLPSKLKPSADATAALGKGFDQIGASATAAGGIISSAAGVTTTAVTKQSVATSALGKGLQDTGTHGKAAGDAVAGGAHQATEALQKGVATAGLLSEAFNITLPRHVRTFIAEMPALGAALEAAFNAAAIFFVIEAIISAGEKIEQFLEKQRKIAEAMRDVEDAAVLADRSLTAAFNSSKAEQIGLTQGAVAKLDFELNHMASDADKVASEIGKIGEALNKSLELQQTTKFDLLSFFLPNSREVTEEAKHFVTELQSTLIQSGNQAGLTLLEKQLVNVREEMAVTAERFNADADKIGGALDNLDNASRAAAEVDKQRLLSLSQVADGLEKYHKILLDGIRLDEEAKKAKAQQEVSEQAQKLAEEAKRDLDQEIANIALRRAAEHQAFVDGITDAATWAVAQKNAVDATTAVQERYAARLIDIFQQSHNADELRVKTQEQAIKLIQDEGKAREESAAAQEKYHTTTLKIVKDWEELQNRAVAKDFEAAGKAADELTRSEIRLADAQAKLALTRIAQDFGPQEAAIKSLADFGIITENQKADRLRVVYEREETEALSALNNLLDAEQRAVAAAQSKLTEKQASPFVTPAEVDAAQKNLNEIQRSVERTQQEIIKTTSDYEQKRISVQRRAVAEAIALAQSEGREKLASDLLYNQNQVDIIREQIREASLHGQNTVALEKERKAREASVKALVQETQGTKNLDKAIVELKSTMEEAAHAELQAFSSALAAALSNQESFGAALEAGTLQVISQLAQHWADYYFALAIAEYASQDYAAAAGHTAAAIAFEAVAGIAAGIAASISNKNQASGNTPAGTEGTASAASQPEQTPVQTVNVQALAKGGLLNKRQLVQFGDSESGGDAPEAAIPLNDQRAIAPIAAAILLPIMATFGIPAQSAAQGSIPRPAIQAQTQQSLQFSTGLLSAGTIATIGSQATASGTASKRDVSEERERHFAIAEAIDRLGDRSGTTVYIAKLADGVISADNLHKVARKLSKDISGGKVRLQSSNSFRNTKRG